MFWKKRKNVETKLKELEKKSYSLVNSVRKLSQAGKAGSREYNKAVKNLVKANNKRKKHEDKKAKDDFNRHYNLEKKVDKFNKKNH